MEEERRRFGCQKASTESNRWWCGGGGGIESLSRSLQLLPVSGALRRWTAPRRPRPARRGWHPSQKRPRRSPAARSRSAEGPPRPPRSPPRPAPRPQPRPPPRWPPTQPRPPPPRRRWAASPADHLPWRQSLFPLQPPPAGSPLPLSPLPLRSLCLSLRPRSPPLPRKQRTARAEPPARDPAFSLRRKLYGKL